MNETSGAHILFPGFAVAPTVLIKNFGNATVRDLTVTATVKDSIQQTLHVDTIVVDEIRPQVSMFLDFPHYYLPEVPGEYSVVFQCRLVDNNPTNNKLTTELRVVEYNGLGTESQLLYDDRDLESRLPWPGDSSAFANEFQIPFHQFMVERVEVPVVVSATSRDLHIWVMNADTLGSPDEILAADTVTVFYHPALQWVVVDFSDAYIGIDYGKKVVIAVATDKSDSLLIGADYAFLQAVSRRGWEYVGGQFAWHRDREIYDLGIRLVVSWTYFDHVHQGMHQPGIPSEILLSNYPNPFNSVTKIAYNLPTAGDLSLKVYDVWGRLVETLVDGPQAAGSHTVDWDASGTPSGLYFYRLTTTDRHYARKMVLLR